MRDKILAAKGACYVTETVTLHLSAFVIFLVFLKEIKCQGLVSCTFDEWVQFQESCHV